MANRVAETIFAQLGGSRFCSMTGAKDFLSSDTALYMQIPRAKKGINKIKIELAANDTYTITFAKLVKLEYKVVAEREGVFVENLRQVFTSETGLETSL